MKYISIVFICLILSGCTNFYRSLDGTSMSVGISIPQEEVVQIEALNYLSGQKTTVKDPSHIRHKYKMVETNSYFGCINTSRIAESEIEIDPVIITNVIEKVEK